jgi:thiol:disulfide interchange protein DsbD
MLFYFPAPGGTVESGSKSHVRVELVAQTLSIQPGMPFRVGVEFTPEKPWKIYWRNPGASGLPTRLAWDLPGGTRHGDTLWPYPERFEYQGIVSYGYSDTTSLLTKITPPSDLIEGQTFPLAASVSWLACDDECIQGQSVLSLALPVSGATPIENPAWLRIETSGEKRLPRQMDAESAGYRIADSRLILELESDALDLSDALEVVFFPELPDIIADETMPDTEWSKSKFQLSQALSEYHPGSREPLSGVLVARTPKGKHAYGFQAGYRPLSSPPVTDAGSTVVQSENNLLIMILLAMAGGILLNLMPCVFPVLSLKAISLVQAHELSGMAHKCHGMAYTIGVMTFFAIVSGVLYFLKAGGASIGWGFHLQTPWFVALMAYLLFILGLGFSGLLEIGAGTMGIGQFLTQSKGYAGSFMTGALAAVVASPCTAPFMGTAVVFAITQPPLSALLVFLSLAFGMALPFLLIAFIPDIGRFLPKPGPWMDIFKQAMAFPLYLTAIWLLWVLGRQTDASIMALVLVGILLLLFAVWLRKVEAGSRGRWRHFKTALSLAAVAGSFAMLWLPGLSITSPQTTGRVLAQDSFWEPYSEERLAELRAQHRPVFLNITADWCISCIANERVALSMTSVRDAFREKNIAALKGDWTNNHPRITEILESFNRNGVPLYVLYPPGEDVEPIMLPQWLTPFNVISALESI